MISKQEIKEWSSQEVTQKLFEHLKWIREDMLSQYEDGQLSSDLKSNYHYHLGRFNLIKVILDLSIFDDPSSDIQENNNDEIG